MIEVPFSGNIKDISLPKILTYLNRNRKSGTLVIKTPVFTKKVYLVKGDAVFASSTFEDDRLGEMLIKAGKISMEQYDESVELLKKTGKRQGAILVELGYLTPKDLFWGVKYQVKEITYSLFLLEDAGYEFIEGEIPANEVITLKMSMGNLIYEGVKRIDNWTRIRSEMPGTDTIFKLSTDPASLFQDVELGSQDRKMLSLIDGTKTMKDLLDSALIGSFEAMKTLYVLRSIGVIEEKKKALDLEKAEETLESIITEEIFQPVSQDEDYFIGNVDKLYLNLDMLSPYELLEIDTDADEETIKKNYYRLTKEFHPDRSFGSSDPSLKDKLTAIFDALTRAYNMLKVYGKTDTGTKISERVEKEEFRGIKDAEEDFRLGIEEFKKGSFNGAVAAFRLATESEPGDAKYWSYLSLALTKMPDRLKDAEKAQFEAIKLEPGNADHYVNLGMIYMREGERKMAYDQFDKALKLDPSNEKAKKGIEKTKG